MPMHVLLTTLAKDRPGIVEEVSGWVNEHGGNIQDSRMAQLSGEFATLILANGDDELLQRLEAAREDFEKNAGLTIFLRPASEPGVPDKSYLRYKLTATSLDQTGIVHQIAGFLRRKGVNIVSAETRRKSAPFTGAPVFHLEMDIDIPGSVPAARLRDELKDFGEEESIDVMLRAE